MPVAIVTGGSRGIGAEVCRQLAANGYDICFSYLDNLDAAQQVTADIHAFGQQAQAVQADIADPQAVDRLFSQCDKTLGTLAVLVNNAGIVADKARVDEISNERFNHMMQVNVLGTFYCSKAAVLRMSSRHGGHGGAIVNLSSVASRIGSPGEYVDYAASKGAVDSFSLGLAKEVATEGIRVNVVRPGIIDTDIHASGGQPDRAQRLASQVPMQRPGMASEVAAAVVWLLSAQASYTTGATIDVSGAR